MGRGALRKKLVALSVILLLVLSSTSIANSYSVGLDAGGAGQGSFKEPNQAGNYFSKGPIQYEVKLSDGASTNDNNPSSEEKQLKDGKISRQIQLHLSDGASSSSQFPHEDKVLLTKQNSDRKAIMEKIFYADRFRLHERPLGRDRARGPRPDASPWERP